MASLEVAAWNVCLAKGDKPLEGDLLSAEPFVCGCCGLIQRYA